jgi:hypothetical protein
MNINKLTPGMTVYDVGRVKMGNTTMRTIAVWHVRIISVDLASGTVVACWNSNPERKYRERQWKKWRAKEPVLIPVGWGKRLATREELAAMKTQ